MCAAVIADHGGVWNGELWLPREGESGCAVHLSWVALRDGDGRLEQSIASCVI
jgi:hypothetical protein